MTGHPPPVAGGAWALLSLEVEEPIILLPCETGLPSCVMYKCTVQESEPLPVLRDRVLP